MKINEMKESKYISKEDVGVNGKNLTIRNSDHLLQENVAPDNKPPEMKWILYFNEARKGLALNQTNISLVAHITGSEETDDWRGKPVQLFEDPTISYGGKVIGGVRVRHVSNAPQPASPPMPNNDFDDDVPF